MLRKTWGQFRSPQKKTMSLSIGNRNDKARLIPVTAALRGPEEDYWEFKATLDYLVSPRLPLTAV